LRSGHADRFNPSVVRPSFAASPDLLRASGPEQAIFHAQAAETTRSVFGSRAFVRAVVEISNHCRENCAYCGMRRDNRTLERHRAHLEDLTRLLLEERPASITDVNIQAGEDPVGVREVALPLIRRLRAETNLGISVCLGTLHPGTYHELRDAGASTYIMKFEIADAADYERFEAPGTLAERVEHIRSLAATGWRVSSGFIAGLPGRGEPGAVQDIALAASLPLIGCSVSPFVPGESTPLHTDRRATLDLALNCMATLRLLRPDWVIPAVSALELAAESDGYTRALRLGANLCTINLTPADLRGDYLIYRRDRAIMTEERILRSIEAAGLEPSRSSLADHLDAHAPPAARPA
jgi:biotin synthase